MAWPSCQGGRVEVYDADNGQCVLRVMWLHGSEGSVPLTYSSTYLKRWISRRRQSRVLRQPRSLVPQDTNGRLDAYEWERPGAGTCKSSTRLHLPALRWNERRRIVFRGCERERRRRVHRHARKTACRRTSTNIYDLYDARVDGFTPLYAACVHRYRLSGFARRGADLRDAVERDLRRGGQLPPRAPPVKAKQKPKKKPKKTKGAKQGKRRRRHGKAHKNAKARKGRTSRKGGTVMSMRSVRRGGLLRRRHALRGGSDGRGCVGVAWARGVGVGVYDCSRSRVGGHLAAHIRRTCARTQRHRGGRIVQHRSWAEPRSVTLTDTLPPA